MPLLEIEEIPLEPLLLVVIVPLFSTVILLALLALIAETPPEIVRLAPELMVPVSPVLRICRVVESPVMVNDVDLALGAMANKIIVNRMTVKR